LKITDIEAIVLANPDADPLACDSAQDAVIVQIHTDDGVVGLGEVDATPAVVKAYIEAPSAHAFSLGVRDLLLGENPLDVRRLWEKLYSGTLMAGRRGMGIHVLGAIDVALWDLKGKVEGKPVWELLGGAARPHVTPYASILPDGPAGEPALDDTIRRMTLVREQGFTAAKIEPVPQVTRHEDDVIEMSRRAREALGPDIALMIDVAYRWGDAKSALRVLRILEELDPFFIETPIHIDHIEAYAQLASATELRIAIGELNAMRFEFIELMDDGLVDVVQPDVPRCGGFTEALRIAELAADRGRLVVPHAWNTGITAATAIHLSAVTPNCPYVEFLPPSMFEAGLRKDLLARELVPVDGLIPLPTDPGLGVELDPDAVQHYRVADLARA
jgi:L-alanine-DL-glutamate epimerase-like enolase superfamily enzyme